jgi:hypothetical protein
MHYILLYDVVADFINLKLVAGLTRSFMVSLIPFPRIR